MTRTRSTVKKPNTRKASALIEGAVNAIIQAQLSESKVSTVVNGLSVLTSTSIDIMKIGELFSLAMLAYTRDTSDARVAAERTAREVREWLRVNCGATHPDELPVLSTPPAYVALTPAEITDVRCGACGGITDDATACSANRCIACGGNGTVTNPALVAARDAAREAGSPVWSGPTLPAIGARVTVKINGIGAATVLGYFVEHGFVGLYVKPDAPPEWYLKQNGNTPAHVFGAEIEAV